MTAGVSTLRDEHVHASLDGPFGLLRVLYLAHQEHPGFPYHFRVLGRVAEGDRDGGGFLRQRRFQEFGSVFEGPAHQADAERTAFSSFGRLIVDPIGRRGAADADHAETARFAHGTRKVASRPSRHRGRDYRVPDPE